MPRATASPRLIVRTTTKFSARNLLTERRKPINRYTEMIKMKTTNQDLRVELAKAAMLLDGWMSRFPAPECMEQEIVLQATREWMTNIEALLEE